MFKVWAPRFFKLRKDHFCRLASNIVQDVHAPAMRHTKHTFFGTSANGSREHRIKNNQQRFAAFQTKSLLADEPRCQEIL